MNVDPDLQAAEGFIEPSLQAEFPGLKLVWITMEARLRRSPRELERRLRTLSNRYRGASVVAMRTQPIPHAYRVFYRQIGLDQPQAYAYAVEVMANASQIDDAQEGMAAFLEKRAPKFRRGQTSSA